MTRLLTEGSVKRSLGPLACVLFLGQGLVTSQPPIRDMTPLMQVVDGASSRLYVYGLLLDYQDAEQKSSLV